MTPELTIVIPTYNRYRTLMRLLESIAESVENLDRPSEIEIVVVDDGSVDDTCEALKFAPLPVTLLRQKNHGPAAARNLGWQAAAGPLVLFLDDDVVVADTAIGRLLAVGSDAAGTGAAIKPLGHPGVIAGFMHEEALSDHRIVNGEVRYLVTCGAMFQRSALLSANGFDEAFPAAAGEDADFSMRLLDAGLRLQVAPDAVVYHDYRSTLIGLIQTYYRHGSVQPLLRERHSTRDSQLMASARDRLSPFAWFATFQRYRESGARPPRAFAYLVLRLLTMIPWVLGAAVAQRRHMSENRPRAGR